MEEIKYAYYDGGKDIVLIITGIGGSTIGYKNKYDIMAKNIVQQTDCSVLIASSQQGTWLHIKENLIQIINENKKTRFIIEFFGAPSRARTYNLSVNSRVLHHWAIEAYLLTSAKSLSQTMPLLYHLKALLSTIFYYFFVFFAYLFFCFSILKIKLYFIFIKH